MVNKLKDIVNKLDGYFSDNQGFAVTSFAQAEVGSGINLRVKPYPKHEEIEGLPEEEHLLEIISRLLSPYIDAPHYAVYKAEKVNDFWELTVQEIQKKTEEKTEETDEV